MDNSVTYREVTVEGPIERQFLIIKADQGRHHGSSSSAAESGRKRSSSSEGLTTVYTYYIIKPTVLSLLTVSWCTYSPAWLLPLISTVFTLSLFWRQFSQRPPFFGVSIPEPNSNPTCSVQHRDILHNCEDIRFFPNESPWALLSCDRGRRQWSPIFSDFSLHAPEGELFLWNWRDTPSVLPYILPFKGAANENGTTSGDFHPLGVSIVPVEGTKHRIFVTNQARIGGLIEVLDFDMQTASFTHIQTIRNPRIHSPNAIVALDKDHFFVTTDMYFARNWAPGVVVEAALGLPLGEILYVALTEDDDGKRGARVQLVSKLAVGTGIEIDRERKALWASSLSNGVYEYNYDFQPKKTGVEDIYNDPLFPITATASKFIRTPFRPDNIVFSPATKKLTVSGVVSMEGFFTSMISPEAKKPSSWTIELLPKLNKQHLTMEEGRRELGLRIADPANNALRRDEMRWRTVFWDDGTTFGGVSTGSIVDFGKERGEGYIGVSLVDRGVIICEKIPSVRGWLVKEERGHEEL